MKPEALAKRAEYRKKWAEKNKEKLKEYHRVWRQENKEKIKQYEERYWEKKVSEEKTKRAD